MLGLFVTLGSDTGLTQSNLRPHDPCTKLKFLSVFSKKIIKIKPFPNPLIFGFLSVQGETIAFGPGGVWFYAGGRNDYESIKVTLCPFNQTCAAVCLVLHGAPVSSVCPPFPFLVYLLLSSENERLWKPVMHLYIWDQYATQSNMNIKEAFPSRLEERWI